jgi:hypothetical protein
MKLRLSARTATATLSTLVLLGLMTVLGSAAEPKFLPDDPIRVDHDTQDASGMKRLEVSLFVDFLYNVIAARTPVESVRAMNVNTVDDVPDSSWFTNRAGHVPLTPSQVAQGPNTLSGPMNGTWTVSASKSDGVTPGFTVKDASGQRWFLKFDPPGHRGMSTGTEVAVTKLMWALGYNVPENYIAYLRREQLVVGAGAKFTPPGGTERAMRLTDIDRLLERADREPDGSYRIVASKALDGKPIGRIRFEGTRPDDPNDIVPHQHRRELRGYGTFAAWLNHVDAKAINSLDTLVTEDGRSYVRHHLIDFGSALGSGGVGPADDWAGSQYLVEGKPALRQMVSFGFVTPRFHKAAFFESPSIGRLIRDNASFNPDEWKPRLQNQAFLHARADDKFWAAQKLMALTNEMLQAAVDSGDFRDPASEAFLVRALAERRDAIGRAYLTAINPITSPALDGYDTLRFTNAAVEADLARAPQGYRATWSLFDNVTGGSEMLATTTARSTEIEAPANLPVAPGAFVMVEVSAIGSEYPAWTAPVRVYCQRTAGGWKTVGFERMPEPVR